MSKKYWHELPQEEIDKILESGMTVQKCLNTYKQPDWCSYPEALAGVWGCWSLTDDRPNGKRTEISEEFCKNCEYFIKPDKP